MKVLVIGPDHYANWIYGSDIVNTIAEADAILFTGGDDIDPNRYKEKAHELTKSNEHRDNIEFHIARDAISKGKMMIGICRGAQLLTVVAGGKLIQHVNGHILNFTHGIMTTSGRVMRGTSTHHQMMYPYTIEDHEVLAIAYPALSDVYFKNHVNVLKMIEEPEVVWYPTIRALAIQPHPEEMDKSSEFVRWLNALLKKYDNRQE